jgi:TfoX/Sxy family transcriptional regulator of competence genes
MAYDEKLAERIRGVIPDADLPRVREQKMFGGLAFLLDGHMFVGVVREDLMVRLTPEGAAQALAREHVRVMDFTGRPSRTMVYVEPAGLRGTALRRWVRAAADHARTLPPRRR